jgi:hypothetical protein
MSFSFTFAGSRHEKLLVLAKRFCDQPNVPPAALTFIRDSIAGFPDGTTILVIACGDIGTMAQHREDSLPAQLNITIKPVFLTD